MGNACETSLLRATQRMWADDATLRAVRVSGSAHDYGYLEIAFLNALANTRAPVAELSLHDFPVTTTGCIITTLEETRAPIRVFRMCKCKGSAIGVHLLGAVIVARQPPLRKVVLHDTRLGAAGILDFYRQFYPSTEEEAVLRTIGQFAATILRPMLSPALHCAQSGECACTM
jgi:hypothetical protein